MIIHRRDDLGWALQKLYLVGFTHDLRGLILSRQKGVKSGGFIVDLDDQLRRTLEEVYRLHLGDASGEGAGGHPPLDGIVEVVQFPEAEGLPEELSGETGTRKAVSRGVLTPKEIQAELRSGKTVQEVARMAGTDASWIERFLSPILAERKGIVDAVMAGVISRPRRGKSVCNVGQAILANLQDRKIPMSPDDLEDAWQVARRDGQWQVTLHYTVRGQAKQAQFSYDPDDGVQALDADASVIGWRPPTSRRPAGAGADAAEEPDQAPEATAVAVAAVKSKSKPAGTSKPAAKAKPTGKAKPVTRREVAAASAALWGATKVTPPTAPARRTSFIGVGKADAPGRSSKQAASSPGKAAGRPQPDQPVKRLPGVIDDRPVFARNSSAPRQKRLMTTADDEAVWRSAVAKTRAARKGPAAEPPPLPPRERPARPQRKRIPDDWLLED